MPISDLKKIDNRPIAPKSGEVLCFVAVRNEAIRLPYFLEYYRALGVHRFFFVDNGSNDGTADHLLAQSDCHCFLTTGAYFRENVQPPGWTNALSNTFGHGNWCVTVDADELLVYPDCEVVKLSQFCAFLDLEGDEALFCPMIDMYSDGPIVDVSYRRGQPFQDACPWLDPEPGWVWNRDDAFPPLQMFGGVRQRVFWTGPIKRQTPPCISKVPLVKWTRGMSYRHSMHLHSGAKLSTLWGGLLHFKFMSGFDSSSKEHIDTNAGFSEKSLEERAIYLLALQNNPKLCLKNTESVQLLNTNHLLELKWIKSNPSYDNWRSALKTV